MQLWKKGHANTTVHRQIGDGRLGVTVEGKFQTVWRSEVRGYCDEYFWSAMDLWNKWKVFGTLPFARTWGDEQARIIALLETIEVAYYAGG